MREKMETVVGVLILVMLLCAAILLLHEVAIRWQSTKGVYMMEDKEHGVVCYQRYKSISCLYDPVEHQPPAEFNTNTTEEEIYL